MSRNERKENMDLIAKLTESQLKKDAVNFEVEIPYLLKMIGK